MAQTPVVYQGIVSARSRRLRTIGSLLVAAIVLMSLYGYFVLMPSLHKAQATLKGVTGLDDKTLDGLVKWLNSSPAPYKSLNGIFGDFLSSITYSPGECPKKIQALKKFADLDPSSD